MEGIEFMDVKELAERILKEVSWVSRVYHKNNSLYSVIEGSHDTILMALSDELLEDITDAGLTIISVRDYTSEEEELRGSGKLLATK